MKTIQNVMLWMLLLVGVATQVQAQCTLTARIYPDTSSCPVTSLYGYAQGGTAPFTYAWSNGVTSPNNMGLQPGTYYLTITDAMACVSVDSFTIQNVVPIQIMPTITPASCGQNNGSIFVNITGGSGNYQIDWYDSNQNYLGNAQIIPYLAAGTYYIYVYDITLGCFTQQVFVVNSTGGSVTVSTQAAGCGSSGSAAAVTTGFTNPTYIWNTGATTSSISPVPAGTYTVTVSDANCTATASGTVQSSSPLWAYLWGQGCPADSLTAYVSGGMSPFTFIWSTGSSTSSASQIDIETVPGPGIYSVTIVDANGCTATASFTVGTAMAATATVQNASCAGNDGAINLSVTGGDGYYYYYWSNGTYTQDISGLTPGIYSVQIYDSTQCSIFLDSIIVGGGGNAYVNAVVAFANCNNTGGAINQTVTGLVNPTYIWNTGATTASISNLASGWYGVTISDNTGCTLVRNYYVDYDSLCYIHIAGYIYNASLTNTCSPSGAYPVAYAMVRLQPTGAITFTDANGYYDFGFTTPGNYSVEFVNNSGVYTVLCPSTNSIAVNGTVMGGYYGNNNFYVVSPYSQDLSISLHHYSTVSPGFGYWTYANFCNNGQIPMSGTIDFAYDASLVFDVIWALSSTGSPALTGHNTSSHLLTFSFTNLQPGQCGYVYVDFNTPSTLPLGTSVVNHVSIYPMNNDATPANNTDADSTICVGSWDPNEKLVSQVRSGNDRDGGTIYTNDEVLDYTIHFQNLGTAPAHRVVVRDVLDANLMIETIRNISMSHNGTVTIENGNELVFTFNNIMLPAASFDYHGSNGYVKFTINRAAGLPVGTQIDNDAAIYFDFNSPVITNTTVVTIAEPSAVHPTQASELNAVVFPNPFQNKVTLRYNLENDSDVNVELYSALGTRIRTLQAATAKASGVHIQEFETGDLIPGVYFLSIETETGRSLHKIVKQ